jgi:hypothetical protein
LHAWLVLHSHHLWQASGKKGTGLVHSPVKARLTRPKLPRPLPKS